MCSYCLCVMYMDTILDLKSKHVDEYKQRYTPNALVILITMFYTVIAIQKNDMDMRCICHVAWQRNTNTNSWVAHVILNMHVDTFPCAVCKQRGAWWYVMKRICTYDFKPSQPRNSRMLSRDLVNHHRKFIHDNLSYEKVALSNSTLW